MRHILAILVIFCACPHFGYAAKKVLLSSVQTLTLHSDKFTTGRRSSPIPQLRCIDGKGSCVNVPSSVQCYNTGSDGIDVQWKCEAQLPKSTQFDTLQVQCEGYDYPDDPYILAGSCGLTYSLKPSGSGSTSHKSHKSRSSRSRSFASDSDSSVSPIFFVAALAIAGYCIYAFCLAPSSARLTNENASSGPSTPPPPSYNDDDDDRPPPYSEGGPGAPQYGFRPEYTAPGASGGSSSKAYERRTYQQRQQQQQQYQQEDEPVQQAGNSGPGFWTGAAVGGLAGYLFGNSRGGGTSGGYYSGGGGCGYHGNTSAYAAPPSSSSSGSSVDDSPVTRTGYASTRRR